MFWRSVASMLLPLPCWVKHERHFTKLCEQRHVGCNHYIPIMIWMVVGCSEAEGEVRPSFFLSSWQRQHLLQSVFLLLVLALARRSSWQRSTGNPFTTLLQYASGCMGYNYSMFGHPTPHPIIHPVPFKSRVICRPYGLKKPCIATLTLGVALPRWHTLSIQARLSNKSTNYYTRANWNGAIRRQLGQNYNTTSTTLPFWS